MSSFFPVGNKIGRNNFGKIGGQRLARDAKVDIKATSKCRLRLARATNFDITHIKIE